MQQYVCRKSSHVVTKCVTYLNCIYYLLAVKIKRNGAYTVQVLNLPGLMSSLLHDTGHYIESKYFSHAIILSYTFRISSQLKLS